MSTRQMMVAVAVVAVALGGGPAIGRLRRVCIDRANPHYLMSALCGNEYTLFHERATTCRKWESERIPWDLVTEEAETLRLCPDQRDAPAIGSWIKQADGWERAALTARSADTRQYRKARIYDLWGLWAYIDFLVSIDPFNQGNEIAPLSLLVLFCPFWLGLRATRKAMSRLLRPAPE
ncbi:hypothetical protein V5E97_29535 [Singulisphaera sp. Ch08]|uniref:Uncharacterized protein n=1 Tax=Singulisphaera sp. Ch08 TaxID=3120278 RepID=A0AAU7CB29_9BACT